MWPRGRRGSKIILNPALLKTRLFLLTPVTLVSTVRLAMDPTAPVYQVNGIVIEDDSVRASPRGFPS